MTKAFRLLLLTAALAASASAQSGQRNVNPPTPVQPRPLSSQPERAPASPEPLLNGFNSIPQTFVLLPDGHIISYWRGYSRTQSRDRLRNAINRALSEGSSN